MTKYHIQSANTQLYRKTTPYIFYVDGENINILTKGCLAEGERETEWRSGPVL